MKNNKYDTHVRPFLGAIFYWKSEGATNEEVAERLGVSVKSLERYALTREEYKQVHNFSIDNQKGNIMKSV